MQARGAGGLLGAGITGVVKPLPWVLGIKLGSYAKLHVLLISKALRASKSFFWVNAYFKHSSTECLFIHGNAGN